MKNFDYHEYMWVLFGELLDLFKRKNADYNNSFEDQGQVGIMVRMHDKFKRCLNMMDKQITLVKDESLDDTLKDLIVYSALLLGRREKMRNE